MKKKLLILLTVVMTSTTLFPVTAMCETLPDEIVAEDTTKDTIMPRADIIDYQYTVINNVLYRRLYNYTLNKPLSGWSVVK